MSAPRLGDVVRCNRCKHVFEITASEPCSCGKHRTLVGRTVSDIALADRTVEMCDRCITPDDLFALHRRDQAVASNTHNN